MLQDGVVEWKVYQQILQEKVKRIRQEELQRQRQIVMSFVQMHFPDLVSLASKRIEVIEEPEIMQALIVGLFSVHTAEEARELLLTVVET